MNEPIFAANISSFGQVDDSERRGRDAHVPPREAQRLALMTKDEGHKISIHFCPPFFVSSGLGERHGAILHIHSAASEDRLSGPWRSGSPARIHRSLHLLPCRRDHGRSHALPEFTRRTDETVARRGRSLWLMKHTFSFPHQP